MFTLFEDEPLVSCKIYEENDDTNKRIRIVSMATGSKCLAEKQLTIDG